jgi:uncharacterized membrane protein
MVDEKCVELSASSGRAPARLAPAISLSIAALLILVKPALSDIGAVRHHELTHGRPFEYPVLARLAYLCERAISGSVFGISVVNVVVAVVAAVVVTRVVRGAGGDASLWAGAPLLVLVGQNWDAVVALAIALAIRAWQRGDDFYAGLFVGLGAAFKIVPIVLLVPMFATGGHRRAMKAAGPAAAILVVSNAVLLVRGVSAWWFPYEFASSRTDWRATIWAALPLRGGALNVASGVLLMGALAAVVWGVRRLRWTFPTAAALSILAFMATNKVWQPHYFLWALPALALAGVPRAPVRAMEWASLALFVDLWRNHPLDHYGLGLWVTGSLRLVALAVLVVAVVRARGRTPLRAIVPACV